MKLATLPMILALVGCHGADGFVDSGSAADGGAADGGAPDGGAEPDLRPWTGTAEVSVVDFDGNSQAIAVEVTWSAVAHDADGVDYAPAGVVAISLGQAGCTVTIVPASHAIDATSDGFLRVDHDGTYRGAAGTFWDVMVTTACPPSAPSTMPSTVAIQWLNAPLARPLTGPDQITGSDDQGLFHYAWSFSRG